MKLGVNENSVFAVFHPDALELFNVCNSLDKVCLHFYAAKDWIVCRLSRRLVSLLLDSCLIIS